MNSNLKVHNLTVKSFRGVNREVSIQLGSITILKGENGTGKSSFINAIEYLFSDDLAFLKNKTIDTNKSTVHKDSTFSDVKIELNFKKKKYIKLEDGYKDYSDVFDDIMENPYVHNASFILNRKKLLQFIEGTQGNRYKAIIELCGLNKIDKIESGLSSSQSTLFKELTKLTNNYKEKLTELSQMLGCSDNLNHDECLSEINARLKNNDLKTITKGTDLVDYIDNLDLSKYSIISDKIDDFKEIYNSLCLKFLNNHLNNLLIEYDSLASDNLKSSQELFKILVSSKNYFELVSTDKCPVCENDIDSQSILGDIESKIVDINSNNVNLDNWQSKINNMINSIGDEVNSLTNLNKLITDLNELTGENFPDFEFSVLSNFKNDLNEFKEFNRSPADFKKYDFNPLYNEISSINKSLIDYEFNHNIGDLRNIYNVLYILRELGNLEIEKISLNRKYEVALKTFNIFKKTKEEFINSLISDIRHDIKLYYGYIHGDDLISSPDIRLTGSKLIDVYLNSFGDVVDSRSYASEGHLDTLGISIFLAFNKKFNPLPLIVFDDVLTTIDLPHKERIGSLIVDKFTDYQFIITTHSNLWMEQLKKLCLNSSRNHIIHEFIDWSLEEGPITSKPLNVEDKITLYLSNDYYDLNAAANTARRYLEYILTQICTVNNFKVPINDKYDVHTLFNEARKQTLRIVRGTSLEAYYNHIWAEINKTKHIANTLSHHNSGEELPKKDVVKFCEDVINLNKAFTCYCGKSYLKLDHQSNKLLCMNPKCRDAIDMNSFKETDFGIDDGWEAQS